MKWYREYIGHTPEILGKKKKFDNTIYTFDIETSSYLILRGEIIPACDYLTLSKEDREEAEFYSTMYIWQFSINDTVYYGRTWEQLREFLDRLEEASPERKILFIHNASYEFQFLKSEFSFSEVMARKAHKVMKAFFTDYNIEIRCSYLMSNASLAQLPKLFNLPVEKKVGDLDYTLIRHSATELTEKELGYCEYDCLVVFYYIRYLLTLYANIDKIPITSTGQVRREFKELIERDFSYKRKVYASINTDPHIYNLLVEAFAGGYTHSNWIYTDEFIKDVDSWDFTSSYPYVLVTHKYPATEFRDCYIKSVDDMIDRFAYLLVVRFTDISVNYNNTFISASKCRKIYGATYDNGRIIKADSIEMTLTDVDFKFITDTHTCNYEILEAYYSQYKYLPNQFINFVLDKYVFKTKYKGVPEFELEYSKEKNRFNALYGMSVTNTIRDNVIYDNLTDWEEVPLTNEEIIEKLEEEKKKSFMSFSTGVWVTAWARNNLLCNVIKLDNYVAYCDTDSMKLIKGYDRSIISNYNEFVKRKIKRVSKVLNIPYEKFAPKDTKGIERMLGVFDDDGHYTEFITQGAKKYAYRTTDGDLHITVAGVPKKGVVALNNDINNFKDDLIFTHEQTNKSLLIYTENQYKINLTDYHGNTYQVSDKSGCCLVPTTYILGKAEEYANLLSDDSSRRAIYKEGK